MVAPSLDATQVPVLAPVLESDINPAGIAVADLVSDGAITDADGNAVEAIAIEHLDTSLGRWEYSRDQGLTWISIRADLINSATNTLTLLLGPSDRIRMVPNGDVNGTLANAITFRAWDMSTGTAGTYIVTSPEAGAFSAEIDFAEISVVPINDAPTFMSVSGNGQKLVSLGVSDDHARSVTVQPDGKIIIVGSSFNGTENDYGIVRLNVDGSLDTSFSQGGKNIVPVGISEDSAYSVAVQSDGKIIVAGRSDDGIGGIDYSIVRLNTDGSPDVSFGIEGTRLISVGSSEDVALGIAVQPDGRLIIVGTSISNGNFDFSIVRLQDDGSEDATFGVDGKVIIPVGDSDDYARNVTVQADGNIIVAGLTCNAETFNYDLGIVRLNPDGSLDDNFGIGGKVIIPIGAIDSASIEITVQPDGKIIIGGYHSIGTGYDLRLFRLNADGTMDASFSYSGTVPIPDGLFDDITLKISIQPDGRLLLIGDKQIDGNHDFAIIRLNADGSIDQTFNGSSVDTLGGTVVYRENAEAIVLDSSVQVLDVDMAALNSGAGNYHGASITLQRLGGANSEDVFSARGNLVFNFENRAVLSGVDIGSYIIESGKLVLTFEANATQARVNEALSSIGYANSSEAATSSINIAWSFSDGNAGAYGEGGALTAFGTTTVNVAAVNDTPLGLVTISASATEDVALTADTSSLVDADGLGILHYQWQASTDGETWANVGADSATFTPNDFQVGQQIRVAVSYTDGQGFVETLISNATAATVAVNDAPTGGVTIPASATEDVALSADTSSLDDADGLGILHYQWQTSIDGETWANVGADSTTFTPRDAQVGLKLRVAVSYTDRQGFSETIISNATAATVAINDAPTGGVTIPASATEDVALTADTSSLADADGLGILHYQWQASLDGHTWTNVGVDSATFTPNDAQVGRQIRVAVSYTDGQGFADTVISNATAATVAINDTPTGSVAISAGATEDVALTVDTSSFADADGLGILHYQWQTSTDGQTWANVGADGATFTPRDAQVGLKIRVAVSYTDGQGFSETAISNVTTPTEGVADVNDAPNITSNGGAGSALLTIQENSYAVTTVTATDPDLEANLKYSIVGGEDATLFQIDQTTGVLTFLTAPDFEAPNDVGKNNRYGVIVQVSDGELIDTQAIEVLVTNQSPETIVGTIFDDVFIASADSELFDGALGIDAVSYVNATSGINVSLASPATNTGIATQDQYDSIEALIGSLFNDTLTGDTNDNWLIGGLGADSLSGLAGNDRLEGGNGNDSLNGGNGDDLLIGGAGNDLLTGGVGIDTASYEDAATGVTVSLALTTAQNTGGAGTDTLTQIENLIGSAFNDILTGGAGANRIDGGVGNDLFIVATAADHTADEAIIGGAGVDELRFIATAVGTLTLSANTSGIERIIVGTGTGVTAASNATTAINVNASALAAAVAITGNNGANILTGGTGADTLIGNVGADTLDGGAGADSLNGGASNDTYIVDNIGDQITELLGGGIDLVQVAIATEGGSYTLADQVENLSLISTVSFSLTGNTAANVITGNAAANILDGDAGVDTLLGGGGSDLYIVDLTAAGALQDLVTEAAVAGIDTIRLRGTSTNTTARTITIGQNIENLDASGTGRSLLNLSGNAAANTIVGNAVANLIVGGALGDTMDGRDGSDIYSISAFADYSDDVINDTGVGATDVDELRIASTVAGTLTVSANTSGLERIIIGTGVGITAATNARTAISVNASALNNSITIVGNAGANNLTGGSGSDTLDGSLGIDTLVGGAGADIFVFSTTPNANSNRDTITDFSVLEDSIALENAIFTALGLNTGMLGAAAFRVGATAADADDRIIYNSANGSLIYDSNGNAAGNAVQIATLSTGLGLTANHFIIV